MFNFWVDCQNVTETAKQFKVSRAYLHKIMRRDRWKINYARIQLKVFKKNEQKIVQSQTSSLNTVSTIRGKIEKIFLSKKFDLSKVSLSEYIALTRLEADLSGNLPVGEMPGPTDSMRLEVEEAISILSQLDKNQMAALGDYIGKNEITNEDHAQTNEE